MVIFEGILQNNKQEYVVKRLELSHLEQILQLQTTVYNQLEDPSVLQQLTVDEFNFILEGNGLMIGAFVNDQLIAIRALLVPEIDSEHLGLAIGLKEEALDQVIYQEISFVHPSYQGNRLQQKLATLIMEELTKTEPVYTYVCATVAPDNIPSLLDKFRQNMHVHNLIEIYGGKLRYVFAKDLRTGNEIKDWRDKKVVAMDQIDRIHQLIEDGYVGVNMVKENNDFKITFKKLGGLS